MADTPLHRLRTPLQRRKDLSQVRRGRMEINSTPDFGKNIDDPFRYLEDPGRTPSGDRHHD